MSKQLVGIILVADVPKAMAVGIYRAIAESGRGSSIKSLKTVWVIENIVFFNSGSFANKIYWKE